MASGRVLVVGGSGFVGSHVTAALAEEGRPVRVAGRSRTRFEHNGPALPGVEFHRADFTRREDVGGMLEDVGAVVFLAHNSVPATSMNDPAGDLESQVAPLVRFLQEVARRGHIERFVYLSSGGTVYGNPETEGPVPESCLPRPVSGYGLTKLIAEHYVRLCLEGRTAQPTILRPANIYGPRQNLEQPQGAVGHFLRALAEGRPITVFGDGGTVRDYVYVTDVAEAVRRCLRREPRGGGATEVFNVGSGVGTSLVELIELIERVTGRRFTVRSEPARSFDCRYNVLSVSRVREEVGWRPRIELPEGLRRTWTWIEEEWSDAASQRRRRTAA